MTQLLTINISLFFIFHQDTLTLQTKIKTFSTNIKDEAEEDVVNERADEYKKEEEEELEIKNTFLCFSTTTNRAKNNIFLKKFMKYLYHDDNKQQQQQNHIIIKLVESSQNKLKEIKINQQKITVL